MTRAVFASSERFRSANAYRLLPFKFMRLEGGSVILVNVAGEHQLLDSRTFAQLIDHQLSNETIGYEDLKAKHFLYDSSPTVPVTLLTAKYRTKYAFLTGFTKLHIFVVTLRCDHSCHYCQVSRQTTDRTLYDMSPEIAERSLQLMMCVPAKDLTLEFQGGEPLLAFETIKHTVARAKVL